MCCDCGGGSRPTQLPAPDTDHHAGAGAQHALPTPTSTLVPTIRQCKTLDLGAFLELAGLGEDGCCLCAPGDECAGGFLALADTCPRDEFSFEGFARCSSTLCQKGCRNAVSATCDAASRDCITYPGCVDGYYGVDCSNKFKWRATIALGWITLIMSLPIFAVTIHRQLFWRAQQATYFVPRRLEALLTSVLVKDDADDGGTDDDDGGRNDSGDGFAAMELSGRRGAGAPPGAEADDDDDDGGAPPSAQTRLSYKAASSRAARRAGAALRTEAAKAAAMGGAEAALPAVPWRSKIGMAGGGGGGGGATAGGGRHASVRLHRARVRWRRGRRDRRAVLKLPNSRAPSCSR